MLPYWYTKAGVERVWREGLPVVSYVHPWGSLYRTATPPWSMEIAASALYELAWDRSASAQAAGAGRIFQFSRLRAGRFRADILVSGSDPKMKQDNMPQVARFWNTIAAEFDAIYTGENKSGFSQFLDRFFRKDIYQRFDWVMQKCGDVRGKTVCDIGCGSGRFVTEFAKRGAFRVTGVDVAADMLKLSEGLVEHDGVADKCDFALSDVLNWKTDREVRHYHRDRVLGLHSVNSRPSGFA